MLKQIILLFSMTFVCIFLLMYFFQRDLIYFPNTQRPLLQDYHVKEMRQVFLPTKDHLLLNAWYKPAHYSLPTLLYLHGNSGNIGYPMPVIRHFMNGGLGVLLIEYRGYGGNQGKPTEKGLYEDGQTALDFLKQEGVKSQKIVLYGESLGSGVATYLATKNSVCAVILQSPYTSLVSLSHYHYPWMLVQPWDKFDSLARIKDINAPLLILHGTADQLVPYAEGLALFQAAMKPKEMITFQKLGHHNLWNTPGYSKQVIDFIQKVC